MRRFFQQHGQLIFPTLVFGVFALLLIFVNSVHEPWRDEAEPWLLAGHASLLDIVWEFPRYLGTPILWHLVLFPFAQIGAPYITLHVINGLFVLISVGVLLWWAPFPLWLRALFPFSYYLLYEYGTIARSYILVVLLVLCIAQAYQHRWQYPVAYLSLIVLLTQTSVHGLAIAGVFFAGFVFEVSQRKLFRFAYMQWAAFVFLLGIFFLTIFLLWPPTDLATHLATLKKPSMWYGLYWTNQYPVHVFFPLPNNGVYFWNSSQFVSFVEIFPFGFSIIGFLSWYFWRSSRTVQLLVISGWIGILGMFFFIYPASMRHLGLLFFFSIACFWIDAHERVVPPVQRFVLYLFLTIAIAMQIIASVIAITQEQKHVFSSAAETATVLIAQTSQAPADTTIIAYPAYLGVAVLPYLPAPQTQLYSLEREDFLQYITWDRAMEVGMAPEEVAIRLDRALQKIETPHVLFLTVRGDALFVENIAEKMWEYPFEIITTGEAFVIYKIR